MLTTLFGSAFGKTPSMTSHLLSASTKRLAEPSLFDPVWGIGFREDDPQARDPVWKKMLRRYRIFLPSETPFAQVRPGWHTLLPPTEFLTFS